MQSISLKNHLDVLANRFEQPEFIDDDPIAVPHQFEDPLDREVIGLYAALLAWGRRSTILSKLADLCERMNYQPYRFVYDYGEGYLNNPLTGFKHRTFQPDDAHHLTAALSVLLRENGSLEKVFAKGGNDIGDCIQYFSEAVMDTVPGTPRRLQKHLARPSTNSACKRLAMYLRWMIRSGPVDFGIWTFLSPAQLILPLDVHTGRQARTLGLIPYSSDNWTSARLLTGRLRKFDPDDPVRYDFALFGSGVHNVEHPPHLVTTYPAEPYSGGRTRAADPAFFRKQ